MNTTTDIKLPIHSVIEIARLGHCKQLTLYSTLKKFNRPGYIKDYKRLDLTLLKFPITRKTYIKYINTLIRLGLVLIAKNNKDIQLIGIDKLGDMYGEIGVSFSGVKKKIKRTYIPNNELLKSNIEKVIITHNIKEQDKAIRFSSKSDTVQREPLTVVKKYANTITSHLINIASETSLSCRNLSKLIGLKSSASGSRREKVWSKDKFMSVTNRTIKHGNGTDLYLSMLKDANPKAIIYRNKYGCISQTIANQIEILNSKLGKKNIVIDKSYNGKPLSYTNNTLFDAWF